MARFAGSKPRLCPPLPARAAASPVDRLQHGDIFPIAHTRNPEFFLMTVRSFTLAAILLSSSLTLADDYDLEELKETPEGLAPAMAKLLDVEGFRITGEKGPVVDLWLVKGVEVKPNFSPTFSQAYPFTPGQLLGALRVPKGGEYHDFRGQTLKEGTYTLRYGLQPMDGNHVGSSETYDFILALPAKSDTKLEPISMAKELAGHSAKAAGATHPAIFSLLDPSDAGRRAKVEQDSKTKHWILGLRHKGTADGKSETVKIRLVVVGESEA